jgi:5-methylthioadenosine/S-adenosylhomocysteine deaminase
MALGLEAEIGSISVGKQADLAALRLSDLETQPLYHVASQLVYATGRHQVSDVWIAGQRRLAGRELIDVDVPAILAKARAWRERIAAG